MYCALPGPVTLLIDQFRFALPLLLIVKVCGAGAAPPQLAANESDVGETAGPPPMPAPESGKGEGRGAQSVPVALMVIEPVLLGPVGEKRDRVGLRAARGDREARIRDREGRGPGARRSCRQRHGRRARPGVLDVEVLGYALKEHDLAEAAEARRPRGVEGEDRAVGLFREGDRLRRRVGVGLEGEGAA